VAQGSLVTSEHALRGGSPNGTHIGVVPALAGADQSASADFTSVDNNPAPRFGIILRFKDSRNYYLAYRMAGGTSVLRISRVVNGVETVLASTTIGNPVPNKVFRLTFRADGASLSLDLDTVQKLSVSDSTFLSGTPGVLLVPNTAKASRADNFSALVP
jgi:hypothetical protein